MIRPPFLLVFRAFIYHYRYTSSASIDQKIDCQMLLKALFDRYFKSVFFPDDINVVTIVIQYMQCCCFKGNCVFLLTDAMRSLGSVAQSCLHTCTYDSVVLNQILSVSGCFILCVSN